MMTGNGPEPPDEQTARAVHLTLSLREVVQGLGDRSLLDLIDLILIELGGRIVEPGSATLPDTESDKEG